MNNSKRPNRVKEFRRSNDLTLQQLANITYSGKGYIHDLENGNIRNPSLGKARLIAMALNSDIDTIFPRGNE